MAKLRLMVSLIIITLILVFGYDTTSAKETNKKIIIGKAAWYGQSSFRNLLLPRRNADGTFFDNDALTCAMRSRRFGDYYKVTNLENGKSVIVKHVDFGPALKYRGKRLHRVIDLSEAAFKRIADLKKGVIRVKIEKIYEHKF